MISVLPAFAGSQDGRFKAGVYRVAMGGGAIFLVTSREGHWTLAALGVAIGILTILVPLGDTQKVRLLARVKAMGLPRTALTPVTADLAFDGEKLTLRETGRVWTSMRPFGDEPAALGLYRSDGLAYAVLSRGRAKKRREVWFSGPLPDTHEWRFEGKPGRIPNPDEVFVLDADPFVTLLQALTGR